MPKEFIPGQGWVEVGNGPAGPMTMLGPQAPPEAPPETPERAAEMASAQEQMGNIASTGLDVASLVLPFLSSVKALPPAMRLLGQAALGAGSGAMRGGMVSEPGLGGALEGLISGGAAQASSELAPHTTNLLNKGAYRVGGFSKEEAKRAAQSLSEANTDLAKGRSLSNPSTLWTQRRLQVGREGRTDKLVKAAGREVEGTRVADPNMHDLLGVFKGSLDDLKAKSIDTRLPVDERNAITKQGNKFIRQQIRLRGNQPVTTEELAKLEVGLKHSPSAKNLRTAQDTKDILTPSEQRSGRIDEALASRAREARYAAEGPNGPMQEADKKYARLKAVQSANSKLRSPDVITDPGKMAARGGMSAGLGRSLGAALTGAGAGYAASGSPVGAVIGSLAGPVVLSPTGMSELGQWLADLEEAAPVVARANRAGEGIHRSVTRTKRKKEEE